MDSSPSSEGFLFDQSNCRELSMEEKRQLVYEISKWSHGAPQILQSWSRQEILQILCAEMGKERKYTGLTKLKIIENLLKVVSEKKSLDLKTVTDLDSQPSSETGQRTSKRQRKNDHPTRWPIAASSASNISTDVNAEDIIYCKNSACKAILSSQDTFCKRCSCCICRQFDDNKDPSLWLLCCSDPPFQGKSCGMSCHLECAIRHEKSAISKDHTDKKIDGSFCCVSCGKVNDLLGSWRKQLLIAKDTRRVDILCYRISLSLKILGSTKQYEKLQEILVEAVKKLEADVGPLTGLPVKTARGIVNRLSSGPEVQKLCASAVESLDMMLSEKTSEMLSDTGTRDCNMIAAKSIRFEDIGTSSLSVILDYEASSMYNIVGYKLWHRKADDSDYPSEPTCTVFEPNTRFLLSDLTPATDYLLKVVPLDSNQELGMCEVHFRTRSAQDDASNQASKSSEILKCQSLATNCSSLSNPSSVEDETNNGIPCNNVDENRGETSFAYDNDDVKVTNYDGRDQRGNIGGTMSILHKEISIVNDSSMPNTDTMNVDSKQSPDSQMIEETSTDNGSNTPLQTGLECVPFVSSSEAGLPITPCKLESSSKDGLQRNGRPNLSGEDHDDGSAKEEEPQAGSSSKKRSSERRDGECAGVGNKDFEYYVKIIRWLECEGHIEKEFRQKFLTWYSLRASPQELRIVKVFVDTLIEDPASLAGQLVDTFSDVVSNKRSTVVPAGFCLKLWH